MKVWAVSKLGHFTVAAAAVPTKQTSSLIIFHFNQYTTFSFLFCSHRPILLHCSFKCDYIIILFPSEETFWGVFFYLKRPCGVQSWFPVGGIWLWSASLGPSSSSLTLTTPVTPTYTHVQALLSQYQRSGEIQLQPDVCICVRCVSV